MRKQKKNGLLYTLAFMLMIILMSYASAESYLPHQQNTTLSFSVTSNFATTCTLTTINSPSGILTINQVNTSSGTFNFQVNAGNYTNLGTYCHNIVCTDGSSKTTGQECRILTENGKDPAEGIVVVFFIILFIVILMGAILMLLKTLGHWIELNVDIIDVAWDMGLYFVIFAMYYMSKYYLGNGVIEDILLLCVQVGGITHIFVPVAGLATTLIMNPLRIRGGKKHD